MISHHNSPHPGIAANIMMLQVNFPGHIVMWPHILVRMPSYTSMGPPPASAMSISGSHGTKRNLGDVAGTTRSPSTSGISDASKRSRSAPAGPLDLMQLEFHNGKYNITDLTWGVFFAMIHSVVSKETFPVFPTARLVGLLAEAKRLVSKRNPSHQVPGQSILYNVASVKFTSYALC